MTHDKPHGFQMLSLEILYELVASLQSWLDLLVCRSVRVVAQKMLTISLCYIQGQKYYRGWPGFFRSSLSKAFIEENRKIKIKHHFCQVIVITDIQCVNESKTSTVQGSNINSKTSGNKKHQATKRRN